MVEVLFFILVIVFFPTIYFFSKWIHDLYLRVYDIQIKLKHHSDSISDLVDEVTKLKEKDGNY